MSFRIAFTRGYLVYYCGKESKRDDHNKRVEYAKYAEPLTPITRIADEQPASA